MHVINANISCRKLKGRLGPRNIKFSWSGLKWETRNYLATWDCEGKGSSMLDCTTPLWLYWGIKTYPCGSFLNGGVMTVPLLIRHCLPTLMLARSPLMIHPDWTMVYYVIVTTSLLPWILTFPFKTMFWLPHSTQLRLTLFPDAYRNARHVIWANLNVKYIIMQVYYRLYVLSFLVRNVLLIHDESLVTRKIISYNALYVFSNA